jgi:hypothetical protein
MTALGPSVEGRQAICQDLESLGIQIYMAQRESGRMFVQIRQSGNKTRRLKSVWMDEFGQEDILLEPIAED